VSTKNHNFIEALETEFVRNNSKEEAVAMENYMKNKFPFFGIKTNDRRLILKELSSQYKQEIDADFRRISLELFQKKEREFHYCGQEILFKSIKKKFLKDDIKLIEQFIITHSWWDSVDFLAKYLLGYYLKKFPSETYAVIEKFSNSDNMWLNRSALLFQLDYKEKVDFELLKSECEKHSKSNEFFIQKAIGWALRNYSKHNPSGVRDFVQNTPLKPLSIREALRKI
jgi:3-methyladenine DNA glycosylase AlkD